jgi:DNA-binding LacI/PurR family transcriptional regulator
MQDVADRAGVSISSVSFVVNGTKRVRPETRERIERAMAELGFRQNVVARALASRRSHVIAVTLPYEALDGNGQAFLSSAARVARAANHHLVVWPDDDGADLATLAGGGLVDGVVLMGVRLDDPRVTLLQSLDFPFALIGRTQNPSGLPCVDCDIDASMTEAMDYLLSLGHRSIVLVSGANDEADAESFGANVRTEAAFLRQAEAAGAEARIMRTRHTVQAGRSAALRFLREAPTATAALIRTDMAAAGFVGGLLTQGVRVPADVSVISFLTSETVAAMPQPSLTYVATPAEELARLAVEALLRRLRGEPVRDPILRPGKLIIGESTGPTKNTSAPMLRSQRTIEGDTRV